MHMRLTWRDAASTVLVAAGILTAVSVMAGWNWPLLSDARAGIVALTVLGVASCALGASVDRFYYSDPFGLFALIVAVIVAVIAIVGGLITGNVEFLSMLMVVSVMLWLMATVRHAIEGRSPAAHRTQPT